MRKKGHFLIAALMLLILAGCSAQSPDIYIDAMPISTNEFHLTHKQTGIRIIYILARYHRLYEGDEYRIIPEYLDAKDENSIDPLDTESLILHVKIVNLKNEKFDFYWETTRRDITEEAGTLYHGKLSRKDFALELPLHKKGAWEYFVRVTNEEGEDLFDLPVYTYEVEGGDDSLGQK